MVCLICDCVPIISLYLERFAFGRTVISKIVISGFCPIHFTVTFAGTQNIHRYTGNIVISRIVISEFHCIIILIEASKRSYFLIACLIPPRVQVTCYGPRADWDLTKFLLHSFLYHHKEEYMNAGTTSLHNILSIFVLLIIASL